MEFSYGYTDAPGFEEMNDTWKQTTRVKLPSGLTEPGDGKPDYGKVREHAPLEVQKKWGRGK